MGRNLERDPARMGGGEERELLYHFYFTPFLNICAYLHSKSGTHQIGQFLQQQIEKRRVLGSECICGGCHKAPTGPEGIIRHRSCTRIWRRALMEWQMSPAIVAPLVSVNAKWWEKAHDQELPSKGRKSACDNTTLDLSISRLKFIHPRCSERAKQSQSLLVAVMFLWQMDSLH